MNNEMKKLLPIAATLLLSACAQIMTYRPIIADVANNPDAILSDTVKIIYGGNQGKDYIDMLENGYVLVGYSPYIADGHPVELGATYQAKRVNASVVILYSNYIGTSTGMMPFTTPTTNTYQTTYSGSSFGTKGFVNFSGNATTTATGSQTNFIPFSFNTYQNVSTFWVKMKNKLGAILEPLTSPEIKRINTNKGLRVSVVIKGSPAFLADIQTNDIISKIGDYYVYNHTSLTDALNKFNQGDTVKLFLFRDGEWLTKYIIIM